MSYRRVQIVLASQCVLPLLLCASRMAAQQSDGKGENFAVSVHGQVVLKRQGWANYAPVVFGTVLQSGDLLRIADSANLKIVCSDLTVHDIPSGVVGLPCENSRPLLQSRDGSLINLTRGQQSEGSIPIIVSPRKTKLLSANPTLRWTAVAGETEYKVTIRGPDVNWTSIVSSGTEFSYPKLAPSLTPGMNYKLIVETSGNRSSSAEPGIGLGFSVLGRNDRKAVLRSEAVIQSLDLGEAATEFLIANLYATYGLKSESIDKLEALSKKVKAGAIDRLLADEYMSIGLIRHAEARYLNAVELAKAENDKIGEMLAHLALARIYDQALDNRKAAREHFGSSIALAQNLGDKYTAQQAIERSVKLKEIEKK